MDGPLRITLCGTNLLKLRCPVEVSGSADTVPLPEAAASLLLVDPQPLKWVVLGGGVEVERLIAVAAGDGSVVNHVTLQAGPGLG